MATPSEIYWRDRINQEMEWQQQNSYKYQREIDQIYRDTIDYVIDDIHAFYNRYGEREGISRREVIKIAKQTDLNLLANRAREYVENEDFSPEANAMLKEYNLTGRANRAELLKQKIDLATHQLGNKEEKYLSSKLDEEITRQMEVAAGIWEMSVPEVDTLRSMATAIKNKPFHDSVWSENLWDRQDALAGHLSGIVDEILLKGQSATTMINGIREAFNSSAYAAKRLLVTETARVQSESQKELMLYNNFEEYRFLAEPTACEHCMALNEKVMKVKDMEAGLNCSPIHPNCRCSTAPEFNEVQEDMNEPSIPDTSIDSPYIPKEKLTYDLSKEEVSQRLRDEFGMGLRGETSRTRLSEEALNQTYGILKTWENLYNKFIHKIPVLEVLPPSKMRNSIAYYAHYPNGRVDSLTVNGSYFKDKDTLLKQINRDVDSGWSSNSRNADSILVHEFGHHIDVQMSRKTSDTFNSRVFNRMVNESNGKYTHDEIAKGTGQYAYSYYSRQKGSHTETFAELFSEAYGEAPREIANDFKKAFESQLVEELD